MAVLAREAVEDGQATLGRKCPFWDIRDRTVNGEVGWFAGLSVLPGGRMLVLVKRSSPPEAMTALPLVAQGAEVYRRP